MKPYMHSKTKEEIENYLKTPSHAVLLSGEKSSGKAHLAHYLAKGILGEQLEGSGLSTFDGKTMGIDDVRGLLAQLKLTLPGKDFSRRGVIIKDIENLGREAQNALLKILEEPPRDTYFIATTSELSSVLQTVVSRMSLIHVRPLSLSDAKKHLNKDYSEKDIIRAFYISDGNAALLLSVLQSESHELPIAIERAKKIIKSSAYEKLLIVDKLSKEEKETIELQLVAMQKVLKASLLHAKSVEASDAARRVRQLDSTLAARGSLQTNVSPKLILTNLFVNL
jgi:DNA polymerase III delta prime subunit